MVAGSVAFTAGVVWLQQQAALPPLLLAVLVLPLAGLRIAAHGRAGLWRLARTGATLAIWALAGLTLANVHGRLTLADALPPDAEGRDLRVSGVVASLPERTATGWRFVFEHDGLARTGWHVPRRTWITLPLASEDATASAPSPFQAGDRVTFTARFRRPHGTANPHGFDVEGWLFERGIRATGYVRTAEPFLSQADRDASPRFAVERLRGVLRDRLVRALPESPVAGVLVALVIGDQQSIPPEHWVLYTRTGVNHLMSISGLHITMLAGLVAFVVLRVAKRLPRITGPMPPRDAAALASLVMALAYAAVAGFGVPAQRTVWMLAAAVAAQRLRIVTDAWRILAVALMTVLAADPMAVTAPGFWLSFGAVGVLVHAGCADAQGERWWAAWSRAQWAIFAGLSPLVLAWFHEVSVVGPVANAIAVPVVSLAVVPLALAGAVFPDAGFAQVAAALLALLHRALDALSGLPWATHVQPAPTALATGLALAGSAWLLMPRGTPSRWLGAIAMLPLLFARGAAPPPGEAWVTLLDVGQGLAVVVRTARSTLLFDTGPAWSSGTDAGARVVVPYLRGEGIARLTALVVSHDDRDHTGGAASVLRAMPADLVLSPLHKSHPALAGAPRVLGCVAGQTWDWDGVTFEMLHPVVPPGTRRPRSDNATSCVLKVSAAGRSALIGADVERDGEAAMLRSGQNVRADVLIVPHHGSRTSSTDVFVAAVAPREAWFPVGYRNRFGHPHADVVSRYRSLGAALRRSDVSGALRLRLGVEDRPVEAWRDTARRYWHTPPPPPS